MDYILLNAELPEDDNVTGIEFYVASPGQVYFDVSCFFEKAVSTVCHEDLYLRFSFDVKMYPIDTVALRSTVADYTVAKGTVPSMVTYTTIMPYTTYNTPGYYMYQLPTPIPFKKGSILHTSIPELAIPINTLSSGDYSDYDWRINKMLGMKQSLYVNLLTNRSTAETIKTTVFNVSYNRPGTYKIETSFTCYPVYIYTGATIVVNAGKL